MKIKLNVDTTELKNKPKTFDGRLRNRLCNKNSIMEITPEQLIEYVKKGRSFTPAVMTGTTGDTWQSQQIICADVDNDTGAKDADGHKIRLENPLTPKQAREVMAKHGIEPYFMYYSFSNTAEWPKYRVVLVLDKPITEPEKANELINGFTGIFNSAVDHCADTTAKDNARMYYGGRSDSIIYISGQTTPISALEKLPKPVEIKPKEVIKSPYDDLQDRFNYDKEHFDLAAYIQNTTSSRPVKRGKSLFFNPCPICGHNDDFQVSGSLYHCHSASGGTGGSIIDYLMNKEGVDKGEACDIFKYDIMGYEKRAERKEDKVTDQKEPKEALTIEKAMEILDSVDDKYIDMPAFPQLSCWAKIRTHDTIVIAADTGAGKSSLSLNFLHELQDRYPIMYINLEMDEATVLQRLVAIHTGMPLDMIEGYKHDEHTRENVNTALKEIIGRKEIQLLTDVYNIEEIEKHIKATIKDRTEPTFVFIDTALLVTMTGKTASRYERFTHISEELRRISRLNNIIMFVLLQQSRDGKKDEDKMPTNSSLKESGSWENDATKILFLWNNSSDQKEIVMTKNRNGKICNIPLNYSPSTQTYREDTRGNFKDSKITGDIFSSMR